MTDEEIEHIRALTNGFRGAFAWVPAHTRDDGTAWSASYTDIGARLAYIPEGSDPEDQDVSTISTDLDQHVAEPIAEILNAVPALLAEIDRLRGGCLGLTENMLSWMKMHDEMRDGLKQIRDEILNDRALSPRDRATYGHSVQEILEGK